MGLFPFKYACFFDLIYGHVPGHRSRSVFLGWQADGSQRKLAGCYATAFSCNLTHCRYTDRPGSAKAQSVEESQQAAVFLIIPLILLIAGQFTGVLLMSVWILLVLGGVCAILAWFLLQKSMGRFTYEKLLQ